MSKLIKTAKRIAAGAALAGVAGYIAGLLTAPKSGRETREEFRKSASSGVSEVERQLKALHSELDVLVDEARDKGDETKGRAQSELHKMADKAKDSKDKVQSVISSVRTGDATDKDLKKAVADAKHAIDHIKDFLKK